MSRVFDVFTDLGSASRNLSGIKQLEIIEGSERMEVGTRWRETRAMMGKDSTETMWVTELTPNKSYSVDAESHGTKYHSMFTFEEIGGATEVTWTFEGKPQTSSAKLISVLGFLFVGSLKKMMAQDLQELKAICEKLDDTSAR